MPLSNCYACDFFSSCNLMEGSTLMHMWFVCIIWSRGLDYSLHAADWRSFGWKMTCWCAAKFINIQQSSYYPFYQQITVLGLWLLFCLLMTCQIASNWVSMFQRYNTCRKHCKYIKLIFHGTANFLWMQNTSAFLVGGRNVYLHLFFEELIDFYWRLDWASLWHVELAVLYDLSALLVTQQSKHIEHADQNQAQSFAVEFSCWRIFFLEAAPEFWVIE